MRGGILNSDARIEKTEKGYTVIGDPTEGALVVAAGKAGLIKEEIDTAYPRLAEIPFDSGRKMMTTFHKIDGEIYSYTKGAPDIILTRCNRVLTKEGVIELTPELNEEILKVNSSLASQGQRVLAISYRKWPEIPDNPTSEIAEKELTFIGFFAILDPAREEAKVAVATSRKAGIKTVMITGDHQDTALAIAKELDIWREGDLVLTGVQLEKMSQEELKEVVENHRLCPVPGTQAAHCRRFKRPRSCSSYDR